MTGATAQRSPRGPRQGQLAAAVAGAGPEPPRDRAALDVPPGRCVAVSRVAAANPLLPVLGAAASAPVTQSAPQTPRMADALQQVTSPSTCIASMTQCLITLAIP